MDERITLKQAAEMLRCSITTLRERVKSGELLAEVGPHGAYLVYQDEIEALPPLRRGRPPRSSHVDPDEFQRTQRVIALAISEAGGDAAQSALVRITEKPEAFPAEARLLSAHRLRMLGLTYAQIGSALQISVRHAERLTRKDLVGRITTLTEEEVARRVDSYRDKRARALVARVRARLKAEGIVSHRPRFHRATGWPVRADILERPRNDSVTRARLRGGGLSDDEIDAVVMVGLTADELNALFLRGFAT